MPNAHSTLQSADTFRVKNVSHHSIGFTLVKSSLRAASDYATSILPSVLKQAQSFTDFRRGFSTGVAEYQTKYATH
jgi:hypothetical protein